MSEIMVKYGHIIYKYYKKYSVSLPPDVAKVVDGLLDKRRTTISAIVEGFIRTDYKSEE